MKKLLLIIAVFSISACHNLSPQDNQLSRVLQISGFNQQVDYLANPLPENSKDNLIARIPLPWIKAINEQISKTLKPDQLKLDFKKQLQKNLSPEDIIILDKFYQSAEGMAVTQLEGQLLNKLLMGEAVGDEPEDNAQLDAMANANGTAKMITNLAESALSDGVDLALEKGCFGLDKYPVASFFGGLIKKIQLSALRNKINLNIYQHYAKLPQTTQQSYIQFLESSTGKKFLQTKSDVFTNKAVNIGNALSPMIKNVVIELCHS